MGNPNNFIMEEYGKRHLNLLKTLELFDVSWMESLGMDGTRESFERMVLEGYINRKLLIKEYKDVFANEIVNWSLIANKFNLFEAPSIYSNREISFIVRYYLNFVLNETSDSLNHKSDDITQEIMKYYNQYKDSDNWIKFEMLFEYLNNIFYDLEYHDLRNLENWIDVGIEYFRENKNKWFIIDRVKFKNEKNGG